MPDGKSSYLDYRILFVLFVQAVGAALEQGLIIFEYTAKLSGWTKTKPISLEGAPRDIWRSLGASVLSIVVFGLIGAIREAVRQIRSGVSLDSLKQTVPAEEPAEPAE